MVKGLTHNPIFEETHHKLKCYGVMADPIDKSAMGVFLSKHGHGYFLIFQKNQSEVVMCPFNDDMDLYLLFDNNPLMQVTIINKDVEVIYETDDEFITNIFSCKITPTGSIFNLDDSIVPMNHNNLVDLAKKVFGKDVLFG